MGTTPRGIPYPEPTAFVTDGAAAMQALATEVDAELTGVDTARAALEAALDGRLDTLEARQHVSALVDAAGDLLVGSSADTLARLAKGADGTVLSVAAGVVGWSAPVGGSVSGSYTGTAVTRTISTTFTPRLVVIYRAQASMAIWIAGPASGQPGVKITANGTLVEGTPGINQAHIVAGGFELGGSANGPNANGVTHVYTAIP